ncbi:unnamed protein product [Closterium sp. NIES-54]
MSALFFSPARHYSAEAGAAGIAGAEGSVTPMCPLASLSPILSSPLTAAVQKRDLVASVGRSEVYTPSLFTPTHFSRHCMQKRRLVEESGQSENMEEVERRARADIAVSMERQLGNAKKTHVSASHPLHERALWSEWTEGGEGGHCCQHGEAAGQRQEDASARLTGGATGGRGGARMAGMPCLLAFLLCALCCVVAFPQLPTRLIGRATGGGGGANRAGRPWSPLPYLFAFRVCFCVACGVVWCCVVAFTQLPDSLEELQEEVEERIGQANRIVCPNPHVLQQFQERQEQVSEREEKACE